MSEPSEEHLSAVEGHEVLAITPLRSHRIPGIEGVRAVAALMVMFFHVQLLHMNGGFEGVELFFVISGYVISALLIREVAGGGAFRTFRYLKRRIARLVPALFVMVGVVTVYVALIVHDANHKYYTWVVNATALFGAYGYRDTGAFGVTWSLTHELTWYIVWPIVLIPLLRRLTPATVAWVVTAFAAISLLVRWTLGTVLSSHFSYYNVPGIRATGLLLGAAVACWAHAGFRVSPAVARALRVGGLVVVILVAFLGHSSTLGLTTFDTITDAAAVAIMLGLTATETAPTTGLASSTLVWVGTISYGIYLWHYPLMWYIGPRLRGPIGLVPSRVAVVVLTFLFAMLSWKLVEQPCIQWVSRTRSRSGDSSDSKPLPA